MEVCVCRRLMESVAKELGDVVVINGVLPDDWLAMDVGLVSQWCVHSWTIANLWNGSTEGSNVTCYTKECTTQFDLTTGCLTKMDSTGVLGILFNHLEESCSTHLSDHWGLLCINSSCILIGFVHFSLILLLVWSVEGRCARYHVVSDWPIDGLRM